MKMMHNAPSTVLMDGMKKDALKDGFKICAKESYEIWKEFCNAWKHGHEPVKKLLEKTENKFLAQMRVK